MADKLVEMAPTSFACQSNTEYTRGLLGSVLSTEVRATRLYQIPGSVPSSPYDFVVETVLQVVHYDQMQIRIKIDINRCGRRAVSLMGFSFS